MLNLRERKDVYLIDSVGVKKLHKFQQFKRNEFTGRIQNCVHPSIKYHITKQKAQTLRKASEMADSSFSLTHVFFPKSSQSCNFERNF